MAQYVKLGFGLGLGSTLALIMFMALGMGLFIGGYVMYRKAKKAEKPDRTHMIIAIVLMALGSLIGLGFGGPFLLEALGDLIG